MRIHAVVEGYLYFFLMFMWSTVFSIFFDLQSSIGSNQFFYPSDHREVRSSRCSFIFIICPSTALKIRWFILRICPTELNFPCRILHRSILFSPGLLIYLLKLQQINKHILNYSTSCLIVATSQSVFLSFWHNLSDFVL